MDFSTPPPDMTAWEILTAMSPPIPTQPERGHHFCMAGWKVVDGGVVEWRYQAFCTCYWSQRFPCNEEQAAVKAFKEHLDAE